MGFIMDNRRDSFISMDLNIYDKSKFEICRCVRASSLVLTHFVLHSLVFTIVAVETHSNHKDGGRVCRKLRSFAE